MKGSGEETLAEAFPFLYQSVQQHTLPLNNELLYQSNSKKHTLPHRLAFGLI